MLSIRQQPSRVHRHDYVGTSPFSLQAALYDVSEVAPHDHDFLEIALIASGSGIHGSLHGEVETRAGDVYILRPGVWHSYSHSRALRVYNCAFSIELLQRGLTAAMRDAALHHLFFGGPLARGRRGLLTLHLESAARKRCINHLKEMAQKEEAGGAKSGEKMGHFLLFLGELSRVATREDGEYSHKREARVLAAPHPAVLRALQLLEADCARDWNLRELAAQLHLDRFHLTRLFKAHIGLPPMAYLARLRAERAAQLLLRGNDSIAQIGAQVGWHDANLFSRRFSAHFGLSAREYRRKLSGTLQEI